MFSGSKYPKIILFNFEKGSTGICRDDETGMTIHMPRYILTVHAVSLSKRLSQLTRAADRRVALEFAIPSILELLKNFHSRNFCHLSIYAENVVLVQRAGVNGDAMWGFRECCSCEGAKGRVTTFEPDEIRFLPPEVRISLL